MDNDWKEAIQDDHDLSRIVQAIKDGPLGSLTKQSWWKRPILRNGNKNSSWRRMALSTGTKSGTEPASGSYTLE
jgi:hypothetical protein